MLVRRPLQVISTDIDDNPDPMAKVCKLYQNHPNPFNVSTAIRYQLPETSEARLAVYDLLDQKIRTLADGSVEVGYHSAVWDGRDHLGQNVASGIYLYCLQVGDLLETRKALLLR